MKKIKLKGKIMAKVDTANSNKGKDYYVSGDFLEVTGQIFKNIKESTKALTINPLNFAIFILLPWAFLITIGGIGFTALLFAPQEVNNISIGSLLMGLAIAILVFMIIAPAFILTQLESVQGRKITLGQSLSRGLSFLPQLIFLEILSAIAILVGLLFLIIPGFIIAFFLGFAPYILIDKKVNAVQAMKLSFKQVQKYWKPVLAYAIVQTLISAISNLLALGIIGIILWIAYLCLLPYIYVVSENREVIKA